ncbi:hypothetical protein PUN28_007592 [Cardiocondyla obscurior]|uniref:Uncharacterized protein n=1 Tax=Cardiocondyla obscurior TaxID=286306 RepID=A0AAW2G6L5_9HYME
MWYFCLNLTRLIYLKNKLINEYLGEKSPLNSCGYGCEKLESAQPAPSTRRVASTFSPQFRGGANRNGDSNREAHNGAPSLRARGEKNN